MSAPTDNPASTTRIGPTQPHVFVLHVDRVWMTFSLVAAALVLVAAFLPLWEMELRAPQYPQGLFITAYGFEMEGDIRELNSLNHYVGVEAIDPDDIAELKLFPYGVAAVIAALLVGAFVAHAWRYRWIPIAMVWSIPVVMLVDLQYWLYQYGHDLNSDAPMRRLLPEEGFTPKVIGVTPVLNFTTHTSVALGFWLFVIAALLVSFGPVLVHRVIPEAVRFLRESWSNTGTTAASAVVAISLLGPLTPGPGTPAAVAPDQGQALGAMVAGAAPGSTLRVPAGTYNEQLVIDRTLTLIADGEVVIDGGRAGDVVVIEADGVTLQGFTIRGSGRDVANEPAGLRVLGNNAVITGNRLEDVLYGIVLEGSDGHTVTANTVSSVVEFGVERRGHLLYLYNTNHNRVEGNVLRYGKDGMFLGFASHNVIEDNTSSDVRYGVHYMYSDDNTLRGNRFLRSTSGAALMYSRGARLEGNEFAYNLSKASGYGLLLKDVDDVILSGNLVHHNRVGLTMDGAPRAPEAFVTLDGNLIGYNQVALELFTTTDVTFTANTFVGNMRQVESRGGNLEEKNRWSLDGRGNYWDDYRGYDANGDGVGDVVYEYRGAFDDLVERNEAVRAWDFTPARLALEMGARLFPAFQPDARAVDSSPLMSPTMSLSSGADDGAALRSAAFAGAVVLIVLGTLRFAARPPASEWRPC